jgi:hypothetical protein
MAGGQTVRVDRPLVPGLRGGEWEAAVRKQAWVMP